jgi:hypothetical protein
MMVQSLDPRGARLTSCLSLVNKSLMRGQSKDIPGPAFIITNNFEHN